MKITLIEIPKEGKKIRREETQDHSLCEKMLKKGGWEIKDKDKFVYVDGKISAVPDKPSKKVPEKGK